MGREKCSQCGDIIFVYLAQKRKKNFLKEKNGRAHQNCWFAHQKNSHHIFA
jgi:hypothetical protein